MTAYHVRHGMPLPLMPCQTWHQRGSRMLQLPDCLASKPHRLPTSCTTSNKNRIVIADTWCLWHAKNIRFIYYFRKNQWCYILGKLNYLNLLATVFTKLTQSTQHKIFSRQQCLASVRKYRWCLMPGVVNKGVQGVYGALYFLAVSSAGSQTGSEGQEGSANTLFHIGQFSSHGN